MKPTVGRIVHYYGAGLFGSGPYAATVVFVHSDGSVNLNVMHSHNSSFGDRTSTIFERVHQGQEPSGGGTFATNTWYWPPRTEK